MIFYPIITSPVYIFFKKSKRHFYKEAAVYVNNVMAKSKEQTLFDDSILLAQQKDVIGDCPK